MPYVIIEVMPIITDIKEKGNILLARLPEGVVWALIVLFASSGSFGLGYLSGQEAKGGEIIIESRGAAIERQESASTGSALLAAPVGAKAAASEELPPPPSGGGQYVASKSGKSYHLPWCSGAKQIKESNKIYFDSKEEAEAAGYSPAKNCKGI
jgi:hypothetical protein